MSEKLRAPIRELLDASLEEARVQRMWRGLQQRPTRTPRRFAVAGALVAASALCVLLFLRSADAGPLAPLGAGTLAFDRAMTVLSDGSQIELAADTRLQLLENNGHSFSLQLQHGRARFDVTPGGPRRWRMECGLATVTVVGTELTIERSTSELRVEVKHGIVEVRGERVPGGVRRLTAGQSLAIEDHDFTGLPYAASAQRSTEHPAERANGPSPMAAATDAAVEPRAYAQKEAANPRTRSAPDAHTPL